MMRRIGWSSSTKRDSRNDGFTGNEEAVMGSGIQTVKKLEIKTPKGARTVYIGYSWSSAGRMPHNRKLFPYIIYMFHDEMTDAIARLIDDEIDYLSEETGMPVLRYTKDSIREKPLANIDEVVSLVMRADPDIYETIEIAAFGYTGHRSMAQRVVRRVLQQSPKYSQRLQRSQP
jgi:hypothetical protein